MSVCLFVCAELLQKAVESVLADESFKLPSPLAADALSTAQKLAASFGTNQQLISKFAEKLVSTLMPTFKSKASSCKVRREKMWRKYHSIRTSEYKALWEQFLQKNYQLSCITHILPVRHRCDFSGVDSGTVPPPKRKCRAR